MVCRYIDQLGFAEITLDLSVIGDSDYKVELFKDGINADRAARDYKKEIISFPTNRQLKIKMALGGGSIANIYLSAIYVVSSTSHLPVLVTFFSKKHRIVW